MSNNAKTEEAMVSRIIGIQFGLLSPEEIRKNSVVEITSKETYNNDKPIIGGLFDPRMGTLEPGYICPTDGLNYIHTPGYFGHIELARPVYFIQHLKEILDISRCICYKCSHLLMDKEANKHVLQYPPAKRWKHVFNRCKNIKRCGSDNLDGCGTKQPTKFKQEGMATLTALWESIGDDKDEKVTVHMTAEEILQRFKRISDEDVEFMGFSPIWSRPDWMICQVLPVPPPAMRPSVKHDAQQRREDDLTHIFSNIVKFNNYLKIKVDEKAPGNVIEQHTTLLQYYVAMIVDNKAKGSLPLQQRSGRPLQCIMSRVNSKTGRIRGNLMGKRVNFSARSVITGDPNLSIREIGVPLRIAKNLTKPEIVNSRNREFLMRLVVNGPDTYPGAKTLERSKGGIMIALRNVERGSIQLYPGDIVHRHLMDGDCLLFNRQPSLHRMSMMAHIVRVMFVGDTFRFNVACTKPYNADFDGDEMNTHIPQNLLAETELRNIANIPNQIISPAKNSPIIGIFQDSLLGSYRFTRRGVDFTAKDAMNLLMRIPHVHLEKLTALFYSSVEKGAKGKPNRITNFQLLSQILPPLSLRNKTKLYGDSEDDATTNNIMEIRNGEYLRGQLEGSMLAGTSKGLIHRIFNDFGPMHSADFIDNLQNIITEYMKTSCFSVGINDLIADGDTMGKIKNIIEQQKIKVETLIQEVQRGVFENNTSSSNRDEFEMRVRNLLNESTGETGKISRDSLNPENRFIMIITSGSKGSPLNLSYMISCIGQQNVEGKRVPYGFDGRTLPHYSKYDDPLKIPTNSPLDTPLFTTTIPSLPLFFISNPPLTTFNPTVKTSTIKVQTEEIPIGVFLSIHWFYELMAALGLIVVVLSLCFIYCVYIHVKIAENREVDLGNIEPPCQIVRQDGNNNLLVTKVNMNKMEQGEKEPLQGIDPNALHLAWLNEEYEEETKSAPDEMNLITPAVPQKASILQQLVPSFPFTSSKKKTTETSQKTHYYNSSGKDFIPPPPPKHPPPPPPYKRGKVVPL